MEAARVAADMEALRQLEENRIVVSIFGSETRPVVRE